MSGFNRKVRGLEMIVEIGEGVEVCRRLSKGDKAGMYIVVFRVRLIF